MGQKGPEYYDARAKAAALSLNRALEAEKQRKVRRQRTQKAVVSGLGTLASGGIFLTGKALMLGGRGIKNAVIGGIKLGDYIIERVADKQAYEQLHKELGPDAERARALDEELRAQGVDPDDFYRYVFRRGAGNQGTQARTQNRRPHRVYVDSHEVGTGKTTEQPEQTSYAQPQTRPTPENYDTTTSAQRTTQPAEDYIDAEIIPPSQTGGLEENLDSPPEVKPKRERKKTKTDQFPEDLQNQYIDMAVQGLGRVNDFLSLLKYRTRPHKILGDHQEARGFSKGVLDRFNDTYVKRANELANEIIREMTQVRNVGELNKIREGYGFLNEAVHQHNFPRETLKRMEDQYTALKFSEIPEK
jgi:hypothetical protein